MNWVMPAYAPDGSKLHSLAGNPKRHRFITYWNDACWHRSVPSDCSGLSYLDIGSNEGLWLLRFEHSGGESFGLDFNKHGQITRNADGVDLSEEYSRPNYIALKQMYEANYAAKVGGFIDGNIVSDTDRKYNIVSCFNVLEYIKEAKECIHSMFEKATDRVMLATDCCIVKETHNPKVYVIENIFNVKELLSWMEWPYIYWLEDFGPPHFNKWQIFISATNPNSQLAKIDGSTVEYDRDLEITETQKHRSSKEK